jgi:predicted DNA-binding protein
MMTLRLDPELEASLISLSKRKGMSKSAVIKEALRLYLKNEKSDKTPYDLGADLFGKESSAGGEADASGTYKRRLKEKLHGKYPH